jgi:hypothetical protein
MEECRAAVSLMRRTVGSFNTLSVGQTVRGFR